jgi:hypothetical protein
MLLSYLELRGKPKNMSALAVEAESSGQSRRRRAKDVKKSGGVSGNLPHFQSL